MKHKIASLLDKLRQTKPLVHNITNFVVMSTTANALLSLGASPIMAHAPEEIDDIIKIADALVLNIGTLSKSWVNSMVIAAKSAKVKGIPIILDPVGAGASKFRTNIAQQLISDFSPSVLKGNASEIIACAGIESKTKGVDSVNNVNDAKMSALEISRKYHLTVAVTGPEDFITDGQRYFIVKNGHALMSKVTGTGCMASAIVGAFCAIENDLSLATASALSVFGIAGELAATECPGPGTFSIKLIDSLYQITPDTIEKFARIECQNL
jgi:hydroxyethylthiazole kinase